MEADQSLIMDELVEKYTHYEQPDVTFEKFVRKNPWFLIALVAVILGVGSPRPLWISTLTLPIISRRIPLPR